jgi:DNA helicase HerA-like ATPase
MFDFEELESQLLGTVTGGSWRDGISVKLANGVSVEDVTVGKFVTIQGNRNRFFAVVTDLSLETSEARLRMNPPDSEFMASVLEGASVFGQLKLVPYLLMSGSTTALIDGPQPAKTLPAHFSQVTSASEDDIALVFGREDEKHFYIGNPLDLEAKVCLDMGKFVQRSNGVFGKSGTGKTFLTRLLLIGILQKGVASNLIFDMHSEYGWTGRDSERARAVKGLKQLFPSQVAVFSLDEESSRRKGLSPDYIVQISYQEIEPEDIELLAGVLNLSPIQTQLIYPIAVTLRRDSGDDWLNKFLELRPGSQEFDSLMNDINNPVPGTIIALRRKLQSLKRMAFLSEQSTTRTGDVVNRIIEYLDRGLHVVLEFGRYGNDLPSYILVANLLTRRIHEKYVQRTELAMGDESQQPHPLVITIEEAHRFLNPGIASETIFGSIAREMRKFNVTLLVVDQRPSGIDDEILSQIATKITCSLDNDKDVDAVLSGVSGRSELRAILSRMESRQQALVFGDAVPMPIVIRTREYGSAASYAEFESFEQQRNIWESNSSTDQVEKDDLW